MKLNVLVFLTPMLAAMASVAECCEECERDAIPVAGRDWSCDLPGCIEAEIFCPNYNFLPRAMGSRNLFFGDATGAMCTNMYEQVFVDEEEILIFFSPDGGFTLYAQCPHKNQVIVRFKLCVMDGLIPAVTLHCRFLKDPDRIEVKYNASSEDMYDASVDCGENAAVQGMYFMDPGAGIVTRVVFSCLKIRIEP